MPSTCKLTALALADMADDAGKCWPSVPTLARKTGQSERTVQGNLCELERAGAMKRDERPGRSTVYTLTPADFAPPQDLRPTPASSAPPLAQELRPTPAEVAPRIIKETSVETKEKPLARLNGERHDLEERFALFWKAYPRKVAKPAAQRAWFKIQPTEDTAVSIIGDVVARCNSPDWLKDRGAYIPHPATYLNQRRWEDTPTDTNSGRTFADEMTKGTL